MSTPYLGRLTVCSLALASCLCRDATAEPARLTHATLMLVLGAPGEPEYGSNFLRQAESWSKAGQLAGAKTIQLGLDPAPGTNDLEQLKHVLEIEPKAGDLPLWLILIGHGSYDGKEARFNLRGPDLSPVELQTWLRPFQRPLVIVNAAAASAPFLKQLSATNRVVVTATRSGNEQNFARFGSFLAEAILDPQSDLDKDGQVSILEAFLAASSQIAEYYKGEGRLATEHALIDDDGNGLGTPANWFRGVIPIKKAEGQNSPDGARARQSHLILSSVELATPPEIRARRDALELNLTQLRETKSHRPAPEYYAELERLLLELASLYGDAL